MVGAIPPLPNTPSWCGAHVRAQGQLYLYLHTLFYFTLTKLWVS